MSQENVEVMRTVYDRYREGDLRASADLLDPHAVLVLPKASDWGPDTPESGLFIGPEGIAEYTRHMLLKPWADFTLEAEEIVEAGDSVLIRVIQRAVGRTSGIPVELRYFTLWSFRGRQVIRIESFRERAEALEAAGLSA
ncbi:MAG: nuclear transport factor 2 family protein [Actinomycetota bacterium]|nr:nuclear transport factor 2 family protein [Actinomycetota bacterium]